MGFDLADEGHFAAIEYGEVGGLPGLAHDALHDGAALFCDAGPSNEIHADPEALQSDIPELTRLIEFDDAVFVQRRKYPVAGCRRLPSGLRDPGQCHAAAGRNRLQHIDGAVERLDDYVLRLVVKGFWAAPISAGNGVHSLLLLNF